MKLLKNIFTFGITISILIVIFTSCDPDMDAEGERRRMYFSIENCTGDSIFVSHLVKEEYEYYSNFELFYSNYDKDLGIPPYDSIFEIPPKGKYNKFVIGVYCPKWPGFLTSRYQHQIKIFSKDTVKKYSTKELLKKEVYIAKYILTTPQIHEMDSVVKYPLEDYSEIEN